MEIVVQRVSVWWSAEARGARAAAARRDLPKVFPLASDRGGSVLWHDVAMREWRGYEPEESVRHGQSERYHWGLYLHELDGLLTVSRASNADAFPQRWPRPLFTLAPEQVGVYRANFRFTSASHMSAWWYSDWVLRVGYRTWHTATPNVLVDDRVSLYGNSRSRGR